MLPGVLGDKPEEAPPASASFTSFASQEQAHILTDLVTGWKVSWKKVGGGPSLMLDKASPYNTLQLSPYYGKKSQNVYAIAPFLTALGTAQSIMLAERLTLFPADDTPTTSLYFCVSVRVPFICRSIH